MGDQGHRISVAAEEAKVHPETLRRWDREGLLIASRNDAGWLYYTAEQVETARRLARKRRRVMPR